MESLEEVRHRVLYSGRVQGVGFRMTTARIARSHPVRGFVQNLPDGRVELVAVGKEDEVRRFLDAVAAHFQRNIQAQLEEEATNGEVFAAFEIRH